MDELGFRACKECGERALIELDAGNGRVCARCYVLRVRSVTAIRTGQPVPDAQARSTGGATSRRAPGPTRG